nr:YihY/virulence factor BrkB family protein [Acidobacteriota bacterium]
LPLLAISILFALIFKFVPDVPISWRDVTIGAIATAVFFQIGKALLALYLGTAGVGSTYGAAGSLVAFVVWVYYSAQIFFFGAVFTQVYANSVGSYSGKSGPQPGAEAGNISTVKA